MGMVAAQVQTNEGKEKTSFCVLAGMRMNFFVCPESHIAKTTLS